MSAMVRSIALPIAALSFLHCAAAVTPLGRVRVTSNVPGATLFVDEEIRGPVEAYADYDIRLAPGHHRLRLEHPRYITEELEVTVSQSVAISVALQMRLRSAARADGGDP